MLGVGPPDAGVGGVGGILLLLPPMAAQHGEVIGLYHKPAYADEVRMTGVKVILAPLAEFRHSIHLIHYG